MNKKAQKIVLGVSMSLIVIILATQLFPFVTDQVATARNATNLNCGATNLSTGQAANCVLVDFAPFWWFASILAVAIGLITLRKIRNK